MSTAVAPPEGNTARRALTAVLAAAVLANALAGMAWAEEKPFVAPSVEARDDRSLPSTDGTAADALPPKEPASDRTFSFLPSCAESSQSSPLTATLCRPELWAALLSAGVVGGAALNSFTDDPTGEFQLAHEGWFGEHTYVGGGDKASHFVSFEIIARELATIYQHLGIAPTPARLTGFGVSLLAGAVIEVADGTNKYGFSWEDLLMDALGAGTAAVVDVTGTRDLIGFRFGWVPGSVPRKAVDGIGRDYSHEIYTADLKLADLARRLDIPIGPARFLLASVTYGVKGYPYAEPDRRQRQLGFEIGLNFEEILDAVEVPRDTWWGIATHVVMDNFRIPYTAGGWRYDYNHHEWRGPDSGDSCGTCRP